jgi:hypothetical protein
MKRSIYITFGQSHYHELDCGIKCHPNMVLEIKGVSHQKGRDIAFNLFGRKFFTTYASVPNLGSFPDGVVVLPDNEKVKVYPKLETIWFSQGQNLIGIVYYTNLADEKKAYIGLGEGKNEMRDMYHIKKHGAKFTFGNVEELHRHFVTSE